MLGKVFNFVVFPFQLNEGDHVKKLKIAFIIEKEAVEKNGGKVVLIPMVKGYSTTGIIEKMGK